MDNDWEVREVMAIEGEGGREIGRRVIGTGVG